MRARQRPAGAASRSRAAASAAPVRPRSRSRSAPSLAIGSQSPVSDSAACGKGPVVALVDLGLQRRQACARGPRPSGRRPAASVASSAVEPGGVGAAVGQQPHALAVGLLVGAGVGRRGRARRRTPAGRRTAGGRRRPPGTGGPGPGSARPGAGGRPGGRAGRVSPSRRTRRRAAPACSTPVPSRTGSSSSPDATGGRHGPGPASASPGSRGGPPRPGWRRAGRGPASAG